MRDGYGIPQEHALCSSYRHHLRGCGRVLGNSNRFRRKQLLDIEAGRWKPQRKSRTLLLARIFQRGVHKERFIDGPLANSWSRCSVRCHWACFASQISSKACRINGIRGRDHLIDVNPPRSCGGRIRDADGTCSLRGILRDLHARNALLEGHENDRPRELS